MLRPFITLVFAMFFGFAVADDMRPASLTITETAANEFNLVWKLPVINGKAQQTSFELSPDASLLSPPRKVTLNNLQSEYASYKREKGFHQLAIKINGLSIASGDVIVRAVDLNGASKTTILNIDNTELVLTNMDNLTSFETSIEYIILGVEHILIGLDHLLFVACLVYISNSRRKLFYTITGFTLAHSVTLFLSATGVVSLNIAAVETVIALSIVLLAWEIAKKQKDSLTLRYPVAVSSSFGLLHGFGFAAVLAEIGLPAQEKLNALVSFNIGVEIGQLLFVAALFLALAFARLVYKALDIEKLRIPISYSCGILASYWVIERAVSIG